MSRTRTHRRLGFGLAAAVFLLDQLIKWIVTHPLHLPERLVIEIVPVFRLAWVQNFGVSMGFLVAASDTQRWALVALTGVIACAVVVWLWRERSSGDAVALALVLGGACGNVLDRVRLGYVADFLDLHFGEYRPFLVFNVADAAITIGVLLLLLRALLTGKQPDRAEDVHA